MDLFKEYQVIPLNDFIFLKRLDPENLTQAGLYLPESAREKKVTATVLAKGPGRVVDGKRSRIRLEKGDSVILDVIAGIEMKIGDRTYIICREAEVMAVIKKK